MNNCPWYEIECESKDCCECSFNEEEGENEEHEVPVR